MNPFINITPPPDNNRHRDHVPIGIRVRYAISMLIGVLALYGAGQAYYSAHSTSRQQDRTAELTRELGEQVAYAQGIAARQSELVGRVASLVVRISSDEQQTCRIQRRGLPAGHELAASMRDIHKLLTVRPTTKAQRLAARQTPRRVRRIVSDLNRHLALYQAAEAQQPHTRIC